MDVVGVDDAPYGLVAKVNYLPYGLNGLYGLNWLGAKVDDVPNGPPVAGVDDAPYGLGAKVDDVPNGPPVAGVDDAPYVNGLGPPDDTPVNGLGAKAGAKAGAGGWMVWTGLGRWCRRALGALACTKWVWGGNLLNGCPVAGYHALPMEAGRAESRCGV